MADLLKGLSDRVEQRFSRQYLDQSMSEWICKNTTLRGRPFSMKGYEFQAAIADDMHPNLNVKKCSQVGLTEVQIRKALGFVVRNPGTSAIFSLPEEKLYRRISQTRIKPLVETDKVFNLEQDNDSTRSMSIMQFGRSFLYVTACTEGDATSTAADALFHDEVDLSDHHMLALFMSRLQNSDYRIRQGFSTPSFPGFGVDASYKISDQRQYLHKCSGCGHWNWPQFDFKFCYLPGRPERIGKIFDLDQDAVNEIDLVNAYIMCEQCQAPLMGDEQKEWVPLYPTRLESRGYWVTPFSTSRLGVSYMVQQLLEYRKLDYVRGFYNTVLGETYSDSNTQITIEDIEASLQSPNVDDLPRDKPLAIGIDMGQTCHVVIGDTSGQTIYRFVSIAVGNLPEYIDDLFKKHNIVAGACDRQPFTPTAAALRDSTNKIILPVLYAVGPQMKLIEDEYEQLDYAQINRTKCLDEVSRSFRDRMIKLYGFSYQREIIKTHLRNMVRDEKPEQPAVWLKLEGPSTPDHYFHAIGYYKVALKLKDLIATRASEEIRSMVGCEAVVMNADTASVHGFTKRQSPALVGTA